MVGYVHALVLARAHTNSTRYEYYECYLYCWLCTDRREYECYECYEYDSPSMRSDMHASSNSRGPMAPSPSRSHAPKSCSSRVAFEASAVSSCSVVVVSLRVTCGESSCVARSRVVSSSIVRLYCCCG